MQTLGSALQRFPRLRLVEDPTDPEYVERFLQPLPPTATVQATRDQLAAAFAAVPADAPIAKRRAAEALARAERDLARCAQRDAIQATRPEGCWCLGLGGRDRLATRFFRPDGNPVERWRTYCGCAAGHAAEALHSGDVEATRAALIQARLERLWGELPSEYRDWTLRSLAQQSASHHELARQIATWLETDQWLFLWGSVGRGKTGAAIGALRVLMGRGQTGIWQETAALLWRLREGYRSRDHWHEDRSDADAARWAALLTTDVLLLDDLGAERNTDWATEIVWLLISERHREGRRTLITSNLDYGQLGDRFGHPRIPSRIKERALTINVSGLPNLRQQGAA